jgi:hypothetical protein
VNEFWNHLINTALLGTDKSALAIEVFPERIQTILQKEKTKSKEDFFLKAACLSLNYVKTGASAENNSSITIPICDNETLTYTPFTASLILKKLLEEEDKNPFLLEYWLEKCEEKQWLVPVDYLVPLLNAGADRKFKFLQNNIRAVVGKRGQWLAQFNQAWYYVNNPDEEQIWNEGKNTERLEVLQNIRATNPEKALELLQSHWNQESAKDKVAFLACLETNLSLVDEPFLQSLLDNLNNSKDGSKPLNQELKSLTSRLLLSLPQSQLCQEVGMKLQPYFQKKKKLLSFNSNAEINLVLPKKEDDFFSVAHMHHRLGFDKTSKDDKMYSDIESWFNDLVKYLPPAFWENTFQADIQSVIKIFNENVSFAKGNNKNGTPIFIPSLSESISRHQYYEGAKVWINYFKNSQQIHLCNLLPQAELEEFYLSHVDISSPDKNRDILLNKRLSQWSLNFSRHVLQMLSKSVEKYYYSKENQQFIKNMVLFLDPAIVDELEHMMKDRNQEWLKQQWHETVVIPVVQMLETRQEMKDAFAQ